MNLKSPYVSLLLAIAALSQLSVSTLAQKLPPEALNVIRCPNEGFQPQAEMGLDGTLHLLYHKGPPAGSDLYYVSSADGGATFTDPIRVNSGAGKVDTRRLVRGGRMFVSDTGRLHVAWVAMPRTLDGLEEPAAPLLYARSDPDRTAFEDERVLSSGRHGLDAAPGLIQAGKLVLVVWQALADTPSGRAVYVARSRDSGATFAPPEALPTRAGGVAPSCAVTIGSPKKGEFNILYRSVSWRDRNLRNYSSTDNGETFKSLYFDDWRTKRTLRTNPILTLGPKPEGRGPRPLVASWQRDGRVWWMQVDNDRDTSFVPLAPREREVWQCRPNVAQSSRGATVVAWMEGDDEQSINRIGWHGWATKGHAVIGSGKFRNIPPNAVPDIFVRPAGDGFTVIY